jgi:hypothetical protein
MTMAGGAIASSIITFASPSQPSPFVWLNDIEVNAARNGLTSLCGKKTAKAGNLAR